MAVENIEVRLFITDEWRYYKGVRLKALHSDPRVFGSSHARESVEPDEKWQQVLNNPHAGVFGVFHFGDVIGMTGIVLDREDQTTAKLWGSWLEPKWRGKGIAEKMYQARLDWAHHHPLVRRIVVSHRESNEVSKRANQKHGFTFTHAADRVWQDGLSEPEIFYELVLKK